MEEDVKNEETNEGIKPKKPRMKMKNAANAQTSTTQPSTKLEEDSE